MLACSHLVRSDRTRSRNRLLVPGSAEFGLADRPENEDHHGMGHTQYESVGLASWVVRHVPPVQHPNCQGLGHSVGGGCYEKLESHNQAKSAVIAQHDRRNRSAVAAASHNPFVNWKSKVESRSVHGCMCGASLEGSGVAGRAGTWPKHSWPHGKCLKGRCTQYFADLMESDFQQDDPHNFQDCSWGEDIHLLTDWAGYPSAHRRDPCALQCLCHEIH